MISITDLSDKLLSLDEHQQMELVKLQKLCYYCQAWHYTFFNKPLIKEPFFALENGPVPEGLYSQYPTDGVCALSYDGECPDSDFSLENKDVDRFIEVIYAVYGIYSGSKLSELTHLEMPWMLARVRAVFEKKPVIIKLNDMRSCYSSHSFRDIIMQSYYSFNYKKYILESDSRITLTDMLPIEKKIVTQFLYDDNSLVIDEKTMMHQKEHNGVMYEFLAIDKNILLITNEVKEYIMQELEIEDITMEITSFLEKDNLKYYWQYYDKGGEQSYYAYTLPALGIMVNEESLGKAIESAIDMIFSWNDYYEKAESAKPEKDVVGKLCRLHKLDNTKLCTLLGLNRESQLQGELLTND